MYYLQVKQLSHRYGQRVILDQIDMSIEQGQKIALGFGGYIYDIEVTKVNTILLHFNPKSL